MGNPTRHERKTLHAIAGPVSGVGVRSGAEVSVRLIPAVASEGLVLRRADLASQVPIDLDHALDAPNCTAVGTCIEDATLFVEHLMAALHAHRITDLIVEADGPEIPLLDGSATPWEDAIGATGTKGLGVSLEPLVVRREIRLEDGECRLKATPAPTARFAFELEYDHPLIGKETAAFDPATEDFAETLAPARTFALIEDIRRAEAAGLLKGGREENCRIVYDDHCSHPPRLPDEFARHKILDMLGDFYLLGRPVVGDIIGHRTGHRHNREMLRRIAAGSKVTE